MNLKAFTLILVCVMVSYYADADSSAALPYRRGVYAVSETLRSMAEATGTDGWNSGELARYPSTLEPAFTTLGKVFTVFQRLVPAGPSEKLLAIEQLMKMLNVQFEKLRRKVQNLRESVDFYNFNDKIHTYVSNISELQKKYDSYIKSQSICTQQEFKRECDKNPEIEKRVKSLYDTLFRSNSTHHTADRVVIRNTKFDPRRYAKFAQYLVAEMTLGVVLTTACVGVLEDDNANDPTKENASRTIATTLSFAVGTEVTVRNTWDWAFSELSMAFKKNLEEEMRETTRLNHAMSHEAFVDHLSRKIREKYTFALWSVLTYNHQDSADWHKFQSNHGRVISWTKSDGSVGRNVIVTWAYNWDKAHVLSESIRRFDTEVGRTRSCIKHDYKCILFSCSRSCWVYQYEEAWRVHDQLWTAITRDRNAPIFLLTARSSNAYYRYNESYAAIRNHKYKRDTVYTFFMAH